MGFAGVIITDDLGMAAVSQTVPWEELPLRALRAGADLLLICHQRQRQEAAFATVVNAVERGELSESLVDRAVARVQAMKSRWQQVLQAPVMAGTTACIGSAEHRALAASIVEHHTDASAKKDSHGD
jgi:beta-N-acetylhexosaminidase